MHENRETCGASAQADRSVKAHGRTTDVYARQESDCAVVPVKQPNQEAAASAEAVEERAQTKENDAGPDTSPTRSGERVSQGFGGVRRVRRHSSKVGAVCGNSACTDLCGGWSAMAIPTATI